MTDDIVDSTLEDPVPQQQAMTVRDAVNAVEKLPEQKPLVTAAQAKVEAVANLTASAYARASMLQLTPEESKALQADFPDEAFQPGAAGKENLIYIEHAHLRDRLNSVFGLGQWAIVPRSRWAEDFTFTNKYKQQVQASRVYTEAMLLVRGCFVAEAVGDMVYYKNNEGQNYGDAVEGAKTAALRRCAKELGVGLQAWKKEWCVGWWQRRNAPKAKIEHPRNTPVATAPATPESKPTLFKDKQPVAPVEIPICTVVLVTERTGTKRDGTPWTAYFIKMNDGVGELEAATFSKSVGLLAQELQETGETAKAVFKPGNKPGSFELVSLERAEQPGEVTP